jgi:uncharacterized protein YbbK (DUF523 family)
MDIVSLCLAGVRCRYDGRDSLVKKIKELVERKEAIPLCPEQLGGLPTPRSPAEIKGGRGEDVLNGKARVVNREGIEVTAQFIKGAEEVLKLARLVGAKRAILKEKSSSCGEEGVTAALLRREGIEVRGENKG